MHRQLFQEAKERSEQEQRYQKDNEAVVKEIEAGLNDAYKPQTEVGVKFSKETATPPENGIPLEDSCEIEAGVVTSGEGSTPPGGGVSLE